MPCAMYILWLGPKMCSFFQTMSSPTLPPSTAPWAVQSERRQTRVHTTLVTFVIASKCGNDEQRSLEWRPRHSSDWAKYIYRNLVSPNPGQPTAEVSELRRSESPEWRSTAHKRCNLLISILLYNKTIEVRGRLCLIEDSGKGTDYLVLPKK